MKPSSPPRSISLRLFGESLIWMWWATTRGPISSNFGWMKGANSRSPGWVLIPLRRRKLRHQAGRERRRGPKRSPEKGDLNFRLFFQLTLARGNLIINKAHDDQSHGP